MVGCQVKMVERPLEIAILKVSSGISTLHCQNELVKALHFLPRFSLEWFSLQILRERLKIDIPKLIFPKNMLARCILVAFNVDSDTNGSK